VRFGTPESNALGRLGEMKRGALLPASDGGQHQQGVDGDEVHPSSREGMITKKRALYGKKRKI
jgi:hypothetical protein